PRAESPTLGKPKARLRAPTLAVHGKFYEPPVCALGPYDASMCTRSEPTTAIGLLSGTSHDAIDAAAARLWSEDDTLVLQPLGMISEPYPAALRDQSAAALPPPSTTVEAGGRADTGIGPALAGGAAR